MRFLILATAAATLTFATPALAQLRPLVEPPESAAAAQDGVEVFLINEGQVALPAAGPDTIDTVAKDGTRLRLVAAPDGQTMVSPGGFARMHYRLAAAAQMVAATAGTPPATAATAAASDRRPETLARGSNGTATVLADRISAYEPTYGVYGPGDAGAKMQFSVAVRLFGNEDGLRFKGAYTQTMFWALDKPSGPIRPTTYSPELFAELPLGQSTILGLGYRHDSNGEAGGQSIDVNRLFVRATKSFDLGGDWRFEVTPQAWFYSSRVGRGTDLDRYWGYTSLSASVAQTDGLKVAGTLRGNPGTGKGAGELFISYPLTRIGPAGLYLFGQAFSGYGEALSRFDSSDSHARIGFAFTR
ncbi:phospholipase [Sphingomonas sp. So64.6b]|uniref:phospholipase A n=1 Tax=Sphingomonas sp. So64.6b TaxID=2997354 RepID=UPI0015FF0DFE|nr:phospholipase A [Sphingomonas sp. So64.6b]QNA85948.1 phospholipase [Sphingomonas sp. So64.6b]